MDVSVFDSTIYLTAVSVKNTTGATIYDLRLSAKRVFFRESGGPRPVVETFAVPFDATLHRGDPFQVRPNQVVQFLLPIPVSKVENESVELKYKKSSGGPDEKAECVFSIQPQVDRTY